MKQILTDSLDDANKAMKELVNLLSLKHENLVEILDIFLYQDDNSGLISVCIVMPIYEGDLDSFIVNTFVKKEIIPQKTIIDFALQISRCLDYLHGNQLLHRDLKPANILMKRVGSNYILKIGDFGVSTFLDSKNSMKQSQVGTPLYSSPEVMKQDGYNQSADIFSFGVIMYRIMTNRERTMYLEIVEDENETRNSIYNETKDNYQFTLIFLVLQMLSKAPSKRPTASEVTNQLESILMYKSLKKSDTLTRDDLIHQIYLNFEWNWEEVDNICNQILELNSKDLLALSLKATALFFTKNDKSHSNIFSYVLTLQEIKSPDDEFARALAIYMSDQEHISLRYFKKAAEQNHSFAEYFLGNILHDSEWFSKSATHDNPLGQFHLGYCYEKGIYNLKQNLEKAKYWYSKASIQGEAKSKFHLGMLNIENDGINLLKDSANLGYPPSCIKLSEFYMNGKYCTKNLKESMRWKITAAEKSLDIKSAFDLANCYEKGISVTKDKDQAFKWYKIAAERGLKSDSKKNLFK